MHGIERTRKLQGPPSPDNGVIKILIRYSDGRVAEYVADAGRRTFSEDDMLELQKILNSASSRTEWAEVTEQQ